MSKTEEAQTPLYDLKKGDRFTLRHFPDEGVFEYLGPDGMWCKVRHTKAERNTELSALYDDGAGFFVLPTLVMVKKV